MEKFQNCEIAIANRSKVRVMNHPKKISRNEFGSEACFKIRRVLRKIPLESAFKLIFLVLQYFTFPTAMGFCLFLVVKIDGLFGVYGVTRTEPNRPAEFFLS